MTDMMLMQEPRLETRTIIPNRMTVKAAKRLLVLPAPLLELDSVTINGTAVTVGTDVYQYLEDDISPARYLRLADTCRLDWYGAGTTAACSSDEPEITVTGLWGWRERYATEGWTTVDSLLTAGGIDTDDTLLTVGDADGLTLNMVTPRFAVGDLIRVDDELMRVTAVTGSTTNTVAVLRAQQGTAAAAHAESAPIKTWTRLTPILTTGIEAIIRQKAGEFCTPQNVPNTLIQLYFAAAGGKVAQTVVAVLEDRWAKMRTEVVGLSDGGSALSSAELNRIKALLDYWRNEAGYNGISVTPI